MSTLNQISVLKTRTSKRYVAERLDSLVAKCARSVIPETMTEPLSPASILDPKPYDEATL
jgi:hypothetical protein